jgi:hypothetical protein
MKQPQDYKTDKEIDTVSAKTAGAGSWGLKSTTPDGVKD